MLVVFFELWAAPASILGRPGQVLEPSKPHLTMLFGVRTRVSQKCSSCKKNTVFAMFYKLRNMPHTATKHDSCVAFQAFLDMVHGLLQKPLAAIHFLLFKPTLQRGGTCEAHPPPPEGRAERARSRRQVLAKFFLPQHLSFRMLAPSYGLKIPS